MFARTVVNVPAPEVMRAVAATALTAASPPLATPPCCAGGSLWLLSPLADHRARQPLVFIEGECETLLRIVQPAEGLFDAALRAFPDQSVS